MPISPAQCRAARALLDWSQSDLEAHSRIAKKTIADFERGAREPFENTLKAIQGTLEAYGVAFIPENGGGAGVRLKDAVPRIIRWKDVENRDWIEFLFDYRDKRVTGFVSYNALARIALSNLFPLDVFKRDVQHVLMCAAQKVDADEFDVDGRVHIRPGDLEPREFDT